MFDQRERARVRTVLLVCAAAAWSLLLWQGGMMPMLTHPHAGSMPATASLRMFVSMNPPAALAAGWMLMLIAMMVPALVPPVHHLRSRSFTSRRARATMLFLAAYAAVWMVAGAVLVALALAIAILAGTAAPADIPPPLAGAAAGLLVAIVWQCSPIKQRCLNRCHADPDLAAFGLAADRDALAFGATHGLWCAGSCWALMLLPLLAPGGHLAVMLAATLLIVSERFERARPPRWALRGPGKAIRLAIAQSRIVLQSHARQSPVT